MIKSKDEILTSVNSLVGEEASDDVLAILEDITDTMDDYERRISESGDWEAKYNANDQAWREKYKARFLSPGASENESIDIEAEGVKIETDDAPETFEDLFE